MIICSHYYIFAQLFHGKMQVSHFNAGEIFLVFDNQRYTLIACCAAWCHLLDAIWLPIELCRGVAQGVGIFVFEMVI